MVKFTQIVDKFAVFVGFEMNLMAIRNKHRMLEIGAKAEPPRQTRRGPLVTIFFFAPFDYCLCGWPCDGSGSVDRAA